MGLTCPSTNQLVKVMNRFTDCSSRVSAPDGTSHVHVLSVEPADLMPVVMSLEEESFTTLTVGNSFVTFVLTVFFGLRNIIWSTIFRVGIAHTVATAVSQASLLVH